MVNTFVATAAAGFSWAMTEWVTRKKASHAGPGLGPGRRPRGGHARPPASPVRWAPSCWAWSSRPICVFFCSVVKNALKYDDSLDAFGIHAIGGIVGAIGTGILVNPALGRRRASSTTRPAPRTATSRPATRCQLHHGQPVHRPAQGRAGDRRLVGASPADRLLHHQVHGRPAGLRRTPKRKAWTSSSTASAPTTPDSGESVRRAYGRTSVRRRGSFGAPVFVCVRPQRPGPAEAAAPDPPVGRHGLDPLGQALGLDVVGAEGEAGAAGAGHPGQQGLGLVAQGRQHRADLGRDVDRRRLQVVALGRPARRPPPAALSKASGIGGGVDVAERARARRSGGRPRRVETGDAGIDQHRVQHAAGRARATAARPCPRPAPAGPRGRPRRRRRGWPPRPPAARRRPPGPNASRSSRSAAPASLEPPPRPLATGSRFSRRKAARRDRPPRLGQRARAARRTRLSAVAGQARGERPARPCSASASAGRDRQPVADVGEGHQAAERMIAVGAGRADVQEQVDLGRREGRPRHGLLPGELAAPAGPQARGRASSRRRP